MTVIAIVGKTCSGKSVLASELVKRGFATVVSHTTRKKRKGEISGVDYNFVILDEFASLSEKNGFIETNEFGGNWYGKSFESMEKALARSENVVAVLEPVGVQNMRKHCEKSGIPFLAVWITATDQDRADRFAERSTSLSKGEIQERLSAIDSTEKLWPPRTLELDMVLNSSQCPQGILADILVERLSAEIEEDSHGF